MGLAPYDAAPHDNHPHQCAHSLKCSLSPLLLQNRKRRFKPSLQLSPFSIQHLHPWPENNEDGPNLFARQLQVSVWNSNTLCHSWIRITDPILSRHLNLNCPLPFTHVKSYSQNQVLRPQPARVLLQHSSENYDRNLPRSLLYLFHQPQLTQLC